MLERLFNRRKLDKIQPTEIAPTSESSEIEWHDIPVRPFPVNHVYRSDNAASAIGMMCLMKTLREGGVVEIPSLKMRLIPDFKEKNDQHE